MQVELVCYGANGLLAGSIVKRIRDFIHLLVDISYCLQHLTLQVELEDCQGYICLLVLLNILD